MKKLISLITITLTLGFTTSNVMAQPYGSAMSVDGCETEASLTPGVATPCQAGGHPEIYEAINYVFVQGGLVSPGFDSNADTDGLQYTFSNSYWHDLGGGTSSNFAAIGITAGNTNTLGVHPFGSPGAISYVMAPQTGFTLLGDGTIADPFPGGVNPLSSVDFGFVLNSKDGTDETWYSDPSLNSDGIDHMLAFYLPQLDGVEFWVDTNNDNVADEKITFTKDTYLLAWEDRSVTHESFDSDYNDTIFLVTRVIPVPETMSLGLLGSGLLGLVGLRRKKS